MLSPTREQLRRVRCALPPRVNGSKVDPLRLEMGYHRLMFAALLAGGALFDHAQRRPGRPGPPQPQGDLHKVCVPICLALFSVSSLYWVIQYTLSLSQVCVVGYGCGALSRFLGSPPHPPTRASRASRARARLSRARAPRELGVPLVGVEPDPDVLSLARAHFGGLAGEVPGQPPPRAPRAAGQRATRRADGARASGRSGAPAARRSLRAVGRRRGAARSGRCWST